MKSSSLRPVRVALMGVAAAALCMTLPSAYAIGLGRLVVHSALGETLRAQIDVTSMAPEEGANLKIQIAPPESYKAAGMDYNSVLPGTRAVLREQGDRKFLELTSDRAVVEPFVDVILELAWNSGQLVREYTLLFDPPVTSVAKAPEPPVAPVVVPPVSPPPIQVSPPLSSQALSAAQPADKPSAEPKARTSPPASAQPQSRPPVKVVAEPVAPPVAHRYRVKRGDTLSRVARRWKRPGISLDQMLVSMYRANPHAFIKRNMNRMKSGVVLTAPSTDAIEVTSRREAREIVLVQSADFHAYRQRLASAVDSAKVEEAGRAASGKVGGVVEDNTPVAAAAPDKLKLSKAAKELLASAAEERLSKERELKDAAARKLELQKNVEDLKRLSSAASAAASGPSEVNAAASAGLAQTVPTQTPSILVDAPVGIVKRIEAPEVAASASASASAAVAEIAEIAKPPPIAPAQVDEAESESGTMTSFLKENALVFGVAGLVVAALLGGFAAFRYFKREKKESGVTSFLESRLQPDSFFGTSGGQRVDTHEDGGASSSMSYSLSQIDAIGDVDPVAEADVYLAYGRDLQAEEILKEAMRSTPERMAIRLKLLEVYSKRRDAKGFELLATQVFGLTGGVGEDWAKAQEMGLQLDPENQMYQPGGQPESSEGVGDVTQPLGESTAPQSILPSPSQFDLGEADAGALPSSDDVDLHLDLDLDLSQQPASSPISATAMEATQPLPFISEPEPEPEPEAMDFELPLEAPPEPFGGEAPTAPPEAIELGDDKISLEFEPVVAMPTSTAETGGLELSDAGDDGVNPLERKLELAEEFRQIGDINGARDLLQEVIDNSVGALKTRAQSMFGELS